MALHWKLVVDCADPNRLAAFWGAALGYEVEDNSALIERLLGAGAVGPEDVVETGGRKAWRNLAAVRHPEDPVDAASGTGLGRRLLFQAVPEPKRGKNRLHLDLHVAAGTRDDEVKRLEGLGAAVLRVVTGHGNSHVTMTDPEGNEFDVQ
ncbi:VOC family protein [Streptomyces sp. I05A-00742]|uniref:VOC family protein n=1 Tax=Streptomyces sp. I05A-00742 TaxID=2732853 RepID=UPI00148845C0|nr:VOC family protein [Streptomyces sp. I05A-00742]